MAELKPCPFCGGYVHIDHGSSYFRREMLYCEGCDMWFGLDAFTATRDDLVETFNRRADNVCD